MFACFLGNRAPDESTLPFQAGKLSAQGGKLYPRATAAF